MKSFARISLTVALMGAPLALPSAVRAQPADTAAKLPTRGDAMNALYTALTIYSSPDATSPPMGSFKGGEHFKYTGVTSDGKFLKVAVVEDAGQVETGYVLAASSFRFPKGGVVAPPPSGVSDDFDNVSIHMTSGWVGDLGTLQINKDGSFTYQRPLKEVLRGKLSAADFAKFKTDFKKANGFAVPGSLPGMIPDGTSFEMTATSGKSSWTTKGFFDGGANAPAWAAGEWAAFNPLLGDVNSIYNKITQPAPAPADPTKTDKFDKLQIELDNPWTQWKDFLTVNPDGTYTYTRGGPDVLAPQTGKLTKAQFDAITKAFNPATFKADNGTTVGGFIPDGTLSTITATVGGQDYAVHAYVNSDKLGPLSALEKALVGDVSGLRAPVAAPAADPAKDAKPAPKAGLLDGISSTLGNLWNRITGKGADAAAPRAVDSAGRPSRTAGMSGLLQDRVQVEADKAKNGDATDGK